MTVELDGEADGPRDWTPVVATVVVISEDASWTRSKAAFLAREGFVVLNDPTGGAEFDAGALGAAAAIVDLRLSLRTGAEICAAWREQSSAPVVALTARSDEATVLAAFAAGADHVASIDITDRQLVAHLRSVLRREPPRVDRAVVSARGPAPVLLDAEQRVAVVLGTTIPLNQQEFDFLTLLIERAGRVVARAELAASLKAAVSSKRSVDFFVRRVREKIERVDGRRRITVVRGVGFRFEVETATPTEVPT